MYKVNKILFCGGSGYVGNYIMKLSAQQYPNVTHYVMSRRGTLRKGDSITNNLTNAVPLKADCQDIETYPRELEQCNSIVHTVGTLIEGKKPGTSYKEMNTDSVVKIATKFNEYAKRQEVKKNFVFISSEKAPPFLSDYITTKRDAEDFLLNECKHLNVHILRPGFVVQPQDRTWSPMVGCLVNIAANINEGIVQKTPLGKPLDFLFPTHATKLETIADVAIEGAHGHIEPKIWTNYMLQNYQASEK
ncbi:unnamed protein product [Moneuplotes crassus]|uniref:NAD-dependent epimerase/dehydratase domain-containing protein n=1 Tax=Euplotes crassus TaxID=5936 RepID=A0AAD1XU57_EUPCR|nr:unnamed protein product [Moneuplotes crassus]